MKYKKKFVLWCLRERGNALAIDIYYLATNWRIRIDWEDIQPVLERLIREKLICWRIIRSRDGKSAYQGLVLTRSGERKARTLPGHPQDIFFPRLGL